MAKYLFYLPRFHTNAVPWVKLLKEAKHKVAVCVSHLGGTENYDYVAPVVLPSSAFESCRANGEPIDVLPSFRAVWRGMRGENPDVVIVRGFSRPLSIVAAIFCLLQLRRLVIYDQEDPYPKSVRTRLRRSLFRLIGVPHYTSRISAIGSKSLSYAKPLPFACPFATGLISSSDNQTKATSILMVAKYRERKGHLNFLIALSMLKDTHDFTVTLCGEVISVEDSDFCEMLQHRSELLGLHGRLTFVNNVPYADMEKIYKAHDIFVLPSVHEPAAVSPIEAAWCGCAVFLSRDSGTRGYVPSGSSFDFDPLDSSDIARCISDAIRTKKDLIERKVACRAYVERVASNQLVLSLFEEMAEFRKQKPAALQS